MALVTCSNCGKPVSDQAITCPHCGHHLSSPTSTPPESTRLFSSYPTPPQPQPSNGGNVWKWISIALVILIVGVGIGYFIYSDSKAKQEAAMLALKARQDSIAAVKAKAEADKAKAEADAQTAAAQAAAAKANAEAARQRSISQNTPFDAYNTYQLWGTVAGKRVGVVLEFNGEYVNGSYYYVGIGSPNDPLALSGTYDPTTKIVQLSEAYNGNFTGSWSLKLNPGAKTLSGQMTNSKGRTYTVSLHQ